VNGTALPITVLTGFLGAGKTTLVNRLLAGSHGRRFGVIVNEFGALGIDGALINGAIGPVVELANGCICCATRGDLAGALSEMLSAAPDLDGLLVETSGLADPYPVLEDLDALCFDRDIRLDGVVTVIDAENFDRNLGLADAAFRQIACADVLLINKADLVASDVPERIEQGLRQINDRAAVVFCVACDVPFEVALGPQRTATAAPAPGVHRHADFQSASLRTDRPLDAERFAAWLDALPVTVVRAKGFVRFAGVSAPAVVHLVGARRSIEPVLRLSVETAGAALVVIGRGLAAAELQDSLDRCVAPVPVLEKTFMTLRSLAGFFGIVLAAVLVAPSPTQAQGFPKGPIRFIVSLPPGGSVDTVARELGAKLSESFGQPVVIDNRPGGSNIIGAGVAASAAPDGQTIYMGVSGLTTLPSLHSKLPFDVEKDFTPVGMVARMPFVFVTPASLPAGSVREVIDLAKAKPGALNYGSYGNGTAPHLAMVRLARATGIDVTHVPYKGAAPALTDLVSGRISLMILDLGPAMPFLRSGKLKALAVSSARRTPLAPELPTIAEAGVSGYESSGWFGVLAPAGLPRDIVFRYNVEIGRIMQLQDVRSRMAAFGMEISTGSAEEFAHEIRADIARNSELIRAAAIRLNDQ
jgi:tripartite-type tricarboxylate transporter receptor subunit TctC/G3E family GTPase